MWYIIIGVSALIALLIIVATPISNARAAKLVAQAQTRLSQGDTTQAIADFQVATILAPANHNYKQLLASAYLKANRPNDAARELKTLPIGESGMQIVTIYRQSGQLKQAGKVLEDVLQANKSQAALIAKSELELEQGRGDSAIIAARTALAIDTHNPEAQVQLGLCYAVNNMTVRLNDLIGSVTSPRALHTLKQAKQGKPALAYQLYSSGLIRSSRAILINQPQLMVPDQVLLGRINLILAPNDPPKLKEAETALAKAAQTDPANLESHKLLREVYLRQQNTAAALHQADLINQLETGKI